MPGWYEKTKADRDAGSINIVGLIQEQHPDRCKLFMQWKQLDFPVLVDSFNLFDCTAVPLLYGLYENGQYWGTIRNAKDYQAFLAADVESAPRQIPGLVFCGNAIPPEISIREEILQFVTDETKKDSNRFAAVIEILSSQLKNPKSVFVAAPKIKAWRGVVYRMRHDSPHRKPGDFAAAVADWQALVTDDPTQYIWRRRIEQFGPRMAKPYPFYNWVETARRDIRERGETPAPLQTEPDGAELATPARQFTATTNKTPPANAAQIPTDDGQFTIDVAVVPPRVRAGQTARVHLSLTPKQGGTMKWSNEADPPAVWLSLAEGWQASALPLILAPSPTAAKSATSAEQRSCEFEIRVPEKSGAGEKQISGYAFANLCATETAVCSYRRISVPISFTVTE